jgi:hypothetical protein
MQRLGTSGAAALLVVVQIVGCAGGARPRSTRSDDDRRIEAAQREIEAHDRELRRQRAEIEAIRARAAMEEMRARAAIEEDADRFDDDQRDDRD